MDNNLIDITLQRRNYKFLFDDLGEKGEEKVRTRISSLLTVLKDFVVKFGYDKKVRVDEILLTHAILDYFTDISRLKSFHEIERVNEMKILSYEIYWFLRRRPIQILANDEDVVFINEEFCFTRILHFFNNENKESLILQSNDDNLKFFKDSFLYYLKYRNYNAQSIELILLSFKAGSVFNSLIES